MLKKMTLFEREWLKNPAPEQWIRYLPKRSRSARKRRLLACACCRYVWHLLTEEVSQRTIEVAERFADGEIDTAELEAARKYHRRLCKTNGLFDIRNRPQIGDGEYYLGREATAHPKGFQEVLVIRAATHLAGTREFVTPIVYDIFGNPYRSVTLNPSWLVPQVRDLAQTIYLDRQFEAMPILGDALEDAGCENEWILNHCRDSTDHVRGCWLLDLLLGKS